MSIETFIDELAAAAKRDPVEFRLSMLDKHPRHAAVLRLAAEKAGWDKPLPEGRFRGVALHESFSTYVAEVVEITFKGGSDFTVDRVVCAVDCGIAINPDQIRAQMEGGIGFGLGAILQEELTLTERRRRPGELRHLYAAAHRPDAAGRGAYRAFRRAAHGRRRTRRAADRTGGRQCVAGGDRKDDPQPADQQGALGVTAFAAKWYHLAKCGKTI